MEILSFKLNKLWKNKNAELDYTTSEKFLNIFSCQPIFSPLKPAISERAEFYDTFLNFPFHRTLTISLPVQMDTRYASVLFAYPAGENAAEK